MSEKISVVRDLSVPPTLTDTLLSLEVGDAAVIPKRLRACALSVAYYYRTKKGMTNFKLRTRKKSDKQVYVIRES